MIPYNFLSGSILDIAKQQESWIHKITQPSMGVNLLTHPDLFNGPRQTGNESILSLINSGVIFREASMPFSNPSGLTSLFGSSSTSLPFDKSNLLGLITPSRLFSSPPSGVDYLSNISNAVLNGLSAYTTQLNLTETLTNSFVNAAQLSSGFNFFTTSNFVQQKPLNSFDILSGSTFLKSITNFKQNEEELENAYIQVEELLAQNEDLNNEILKLQTTLIAAQGTGPLKREEWYKIVGPEYMFEWFMNKILIRKLGIAPKIAMGICSLVFATILPIAYEVVIHAKSEDIYHHFIPKTSEAIEHDTISIVKYEPSQINDFTITRTLVFSAITKNRSCIGKFEINTTVSIIKIKNGWCLVEGMGYIEKKSTKANRKKYRTKDRPILLNQKIRGWVRKGDLDMFQ